MIEHPLTLHKDDDPKTPGAYLVRDAADVLVGRIDHDQRDGVWRNSHCVESGEPFAAPGPFQTLAAAFAAYEAVPHA